jgi:hypothetical protein
LAARCAPSAGEARRATAGICASQVPITAHPLGWRLQKLPRSSDRHPAA